MPFKLPKPKYARGKKRLVCMWIYICMCIKFICIYALEPDSNEII